VIGVAFPKWSLERLQRRVTHSIKQSGGIDNKRAFKHLLSLLKYVSGDYNDSNTFRGDQGIARESAPPGALPRHPAFAL
jgi:glucose-6-phosphate 1-dehydrogenase